MPQTSNAPFADRLAERMTRIGSRLCVGLDPVLERFPASIRDLGAEEALVAFCEGVLDAVAESAAIVKPQSAFFESHGWQGSRALERVMKAAQDRGIPVILDAKRGDIGSTATAYAQAYLGNQGLGQYADALTINPYLGSDSIEPFLAQAKTHGRGLFVLARTSNPGGREFQEFRDEHGTLYEGVARRAREWGSDLVGTSGYSPVGLVAGATFPEELTTIRAAAPESVLLLPGIGAQGGKVQDVLAAFDADKLGGIVSSSRGIIYAYGDADVNWQDAVGAAASTVRGQIEDALAAR